MMKQWQDFLDSLSTKGGNILVTSIIFFCLTFLFLHVVHHNLDASTTETVKSILSGFAGALLAMLSGNASKQQMQDRNDAGKQPPLAAGEQK